MPNEIDIIIRDEDRTGPGVSGAIARQRHLKQSVDEVGVAHERTRGRVSNFGASLASTNRVSDASRESMKGMATGAVAVGAAFVGVNKVLNDGIAIKLAEANAQTALGEEYGKLEEAANSQAHALGLTTSEYTAAAGQTAALAKNMGFAQDVAAQFGMMMPDLSNKLSIMSNGQRTAAETSDMMRAAMAGEFDPLQTVGINISANTVAQRALNIQTENGRKFTDQQANALAVLSIVQEQTTDTTKTLATEAGKAAQEAAQNSAEMKQAWQDLEEAAVPVLSAITQYVGDMLGAIVDLKSAVTGGQGLAGGFETLANAMVPTTNIIDRLIGKTEDEGEAAGDAAPKVEDLAKQQKGGAQSAEALAKATEEATKKIQEHADVVLGARDADRQFEQAIDDAAEALKENGRTLDRNTQKGRDNEEALDAIAEAAYGQAEAVREAGGSEAEFNRTLDQSRRALVQAAIRFGMTRKEAERYANSILGIPGAKTTAIRLQGMGPANAAITAFRNNVNRIPGSKTVYVDVVGGLSPSRGLDYASAHGGVIGAAATGGVHGSRTMVGEGGREILDLPPGTRVTSNPDTERVMAQAGAGGGPAHVVLDVRSDDPVMLAFLRRMVRAYGGSGTDSVQVAFGGAGL